MTEIKITIEEQGNVLKIDAEYSQPNGTLWELAFAASLIATTKQISDNGIPITKIPFKILPDTGFAIDAEGKLVQINPGDNNG